MLDIKKIKENPDAVKAGLKAKEVDCDAIVDKILELDVQVRALKTSTETKTAQKNKLAKENGKLFGQKKGMEKRGEDTSAIEEKIEANKAASIALDAEVADDAAKLKVLNVEFKTAMLSLPNLPDADLLPGGKENNEPLRYIGEKHAFDFEPKHHVDLCQDLGLDGGGVLTALLHALLLAEQLAVFLGQLVLLGGLGLGSGLQAADLHVQLQYAINNGVAVHFLGPKTCLHCVGIFLDFANV